MITEITREKMRQAKLGKVPWNKGLKGVQVAWNKGKSWPQETIERQKKTKRKSPTRYWLGKKRFNVHSEEHKQYMRSRKGEKAPNWRGGVTPVNESLRKSLEYKTWRKSIFDRDNYTCQFCKVKGGFLQADHIKSFACFPELRFEVSNGRTLCAPCHRKTSTYGVGSWTKLIASATEA